MTEMITFSITSLSGGMNIGPQNAATLTIVDDDSPPTALDFGDLRSWRERQCDPMHGQ
ncbi:MAG: hypothetical protein IPK99_05120 [Flavobacteriales bacterium]|nr:hypothetical protein [Flavobacteriales bacterium]